MATRDGRCGSDGSDEVAGIKIDDIRYGARSAAWRTRRLAGEAVCVVPAHRGCGRRNPPGGHHRCPDPPDGVGGKRIPAPVRIWQAPASKRRCPRPPGRPAAHAVAAKPSGDLDPRHSWGCRVAVAQLPKPEDPASLGQDAALCLYRASKLAGLLLETALRRHCGNHIAVAAQDLALPVTQFTGRNARRSPHHAQAKSANGVKGSA